MLILWQRHFTVHCTWMSNSEWFHSSVTQFFFLISHEQRWCGLTPFRDNALACLWYGHKNAHRIRSEALFFSFVNPKTDVQSLLFVTLMDIVISRIYKIMTLCVLSDNEVAAIFHCNFHAVWFCIIKIQWAIRSFLQKVTKTNEPGTPTEKREYRWTKQFSVLGKSVCRMKRLLVQFVAGKPWFGPKTFVFVWFICIWNCRGGFLITVWHTGYLSCLVQSENVHMCDKNRQSRISKVNNLPLKVVLHGRLFRV